MKNNLFKISVLVVLAFTAVVCSKSIKLSVPNAEQEISPGSDSTDISFGKNSILGWIKIEEDIDIKHYFPFMDKLILKADTFKNWNINEYIIVHSNPWILDSLVASDYYSLQEKGIFNYDQTAIVILHKGDSIAIPDSAYAANINSKLASTIIDVNIPEFTLRLYQMNDTLLSGPVRVGRDAKKYIYVIDRTIDLKTPIGEGKIIRICLLYTSPSPRDRTRSRMPSSA